MALIEGNLLKGAWAGHRRVEYAECEGRLVAIFGLRFKAALALQQQHAFGLPLPGRSDEDAAIGMRVVHSQVVRRDILPFAGRDRIGEAVQALGGEVVFPDAPGRRIEVFLLRVERPTHGEHQALAIGRDIEVFDVVEISAGDAGRDIGLDAAGRRLVTQEYVGLAPEMALALQVVEIAYRIERGRVSRQGALDIGNAEISHAAAALTVTDIDGAAAAACRHNHGHQQAP